MKYESSNIVLILEILQGILGLFICLFLLQKYMYDVSASYCGCCL